MTDRWSKFLFFIRQNFLFLPFRTSRYYYGFQDMLAKTVREEILNYAMEFVAMDEIGGDYLEFGVFEGNTLANAFHFAKRYKLQTMNFYAFDSFEGMPEVKGIDLAGHPLFKKGQLSSGGVERFSKLISKKGVDLKRVQIIPGWYQETLTERTKRRLFLKKAAIIYIDCDLYESTVPVLDFITSYIQDGTILIFDDWFLFAGHPDRGEQRAFREWLHKNKQIRVSEFRKFGWHGNSFIVHL